MFLIKNYFWDNYIYVYIYIDIPSHTYGCAYTCTKTHNLKLCRHIYYLEERCLIKSVPKMTVFYSRTNVYICVSYMYPIICIKGEFY